MWSAEVTITRIKFITCVTGDVIEYIKKRGRPNNIRQRIEMKRMKCSSGGQHSCSPIDSGGRSHPHSYRTTKYQSKWTLFNDPVTYHLTMTRSRRSVRLARRTILNTHTRTRPVSIQNLAHNYDLHVLSYFEVPGEWRSRFIWWRSGRIWRFGIQIPR